MKSHNDRAHISMREASEIFQNARRMDVALQFRSAMRRKGMKSVDVAKCLGVSEANVSRWLRGNQNLSLDTLYLLADALSEPLIIQVGGTGLAKEAPHSDCGELVPMSSQATASSEGCARAAGQIWEASESISTGSFNVVSLSDYRKICATPRHREATFALAKSETGLATPNRLAELAHG